MTYIERQTKRQEIISGNNFKVVIDYTNDQFQFAEIKDYMNESILTLSKSDLSDLHELIEILQKAKEEIS